MITIINANGMLLDEAFNGQAKFTVDIDATAAWKKAGKPDVSEFGLEFLRKKTALSEGLGAFIIVEPAKTVTPKKTTKAENIVGVGTRKWKTVYSFVDCNNPNISYPCKSLTKGSAVKAAKEFVSLEGFDVFVRLNKELIAGNQDVAVVKVQKEVKTPGTFIFFGIEDTDTPDTDILPE